MAMVHSLCPQPDGGMRLAPCGGPGGLTNIPFCAATAPAGLLTSTSVYRHSQLYSPACRSTLCTREHPDLRGPLTHVVPQRRGHFHNYQCI